MKSNKIYFGILVLSQKNTEISKTLYIICSYIWTHSLVTLL